MSCRVLKYLLLAGTLGSKESSKLLNALSSLPLSDCAAAHAFWMCVTAPCDVTTLPHVLFAMHAGAQVTFTRISM